jgi:hypothetical protein
MTSLVSPDQVRLTVKTDLTDDQLQMVIDQVESEITSRIGAPQDDQGSVQIVITKYGEGNLMFFTTEIASVISIVEDDRTLSVDEYRVWPGGQIQRLPEDWNWGTEVVTTYCPADDRPKRTQVIIDLVRIYIDRTALQHESIAGEYAYDAPQSWEEEIRKIMRRLTFVTV